MQKVNTAVTTHKPKKKKTYLQQDLWQNQTLIAIDINSSMD